MSARLGPVDLALLVLLLATTLACCAVVWRALEPPGACAVEQLR